ncbi:MAG: hypothetical protein WC435_01155 [Candidatus Paceibacterota bacterium]
MSVLFRGVFIVDGTGGKPYRGDVLIKEEKIAAVGKIPEYKAEKIIETNDLFLSPGFIDLDSRSDFISSIFKDKEQRYYIGQGITTIVLGQAGASLAPMFGLQENIRKTWSPETLNFDWDSFQEMAEKLKKNRFGVNFHSLAGQANIRNIILGEKEEGEATENEIRALRGSARRSLKEGAVGISFGMGYFYSPTSPISELRAVLEETFGAGKTAVFDSGGMTKEEAKKNISFFLREMRRTERKGKVFVRQIEKEEAEWLERGKSLREISASFNPKGIEIFPIRFLLPKEIRKERTKDLRQIAEREDILEKINLEEGELKIFDDFCRKKHYEGKSFKSLGKNEKERKEKLLSIFKEINFEGLIIGKKEKGGENELLKKKTIFLTAIANIEETKDTFTSFIKESFINGEAIEKTIEKITSAPAKTMGFKNIGEIKEGNEADIALFNRVGEIKHLVVGGVLTIEHGKITGKLGGKMKKDENIRKEKTRWF